MLSFGCPPLNDQQREWKRPHLRAEHELQEEKNEHSHLSNRLLDGADCIHVSQLPLDPQKQALLCHW